MEEEKIEEEIHIYGPITDEHIDASRIYVENKIKEIEEITGKPIDGRLVITLEAEY